MGKQQGKRRATARQGQRDEAHDETNAQTTTMKAAPRKHAAETGKKNLHNNNGQLTLYAKGREL